ncbi:MAG: hypothetical protein O9335_08030 [Inhella sp.]|jgi:hypothetical protein|uniref:hypothetical protein n=1 Tax=Inhella sp. TaxID=1921806 RepID=UPI0022C13470|nr:hypothetical protein [Inhella sp.]MCZ8235091.1 hypothetical protein [Inhella sp.]
MAKPNYAFEKRQREQQKKQKKAEKAQRKAEGVASGEGAETAMDAGEPSGTAVSALPPATPAP